jgi:hypothetical protein
MWLQHVFVARSHYFADGFAIQQSADHRSFPLRDRFGCIEHPFDVSLRNENYGAPISDDVISGFDQDISDVDGDVGARFDDAASRGSGRVLTPEDREVVLPAIINVAYGGVANHTGNASQLGSE